MNNWIMSIRSVVFVGVMALVGLAGWAQGSTLYWSYDGTTLGGTGTWDTATGRWGITGAGPFGTAWVNGNNDTAIFAGTVGAVTLGADIDVGGLWFNTTAYSLTNTGFTLNFATTNNTIRFNNTIAAATITGPVGGTGNVTLAAANPAGAGTLTFGGSTGNGWSGTTTVNAGMTLSLSSTASAASTALANTTDITINGGTIYASRNFGGNTQNQVSDTAPLTFNGGGTFSQQNGIGASFTETIGSATVASGQANFVFANGSSGGGVVTTLSGLTRSNITTAVTFSSPNTAQANFRLSGAGDTLAGQIIGPWATFGSAANAQTDYAIYTNGNGTVAARNIAASAESTWATTWAATANHTVTITAGTATNLTAPRIINSLRQIGGASQNITSIAANVLTVTGSAYANGDVVVTGGTVPTGLTRETAYYVVNASGTTFQLAATPGGSSITGLTHVASSPLTGGITLSSGNNLETYGILNGSAAALAIGASGTGALTTPSGGGNLFLTTGSGGIFINAPITDNGGNVTVVKSGSTGRLILTGNNTFSGGLVVNGGGAGNALRLTGTQSFTGGITLNGGGIGDNSANGTVFTFAAAINGNAITVNGPSHFVVEGTLASSSTITINPNAVLQIGPGNSILTVPGVVSGSGVLDVSALNMNSGYSVNLTNPTNTFSGDVIYSASNGNNPLSVCSIGDSGKVRVGLAVNAVTKTFALNSAATADLTFNTRQFELVGLTGGHLLAIANNSARAFTINTDLSVIATGTRTLTLQGTGTGLSTFAGKIGNGTLTTLSLTKAEAAPWILSGTNNTYNGVTTISAGTLVVTKLANGGAASSIGDSTSAAGNLVFGLGTVLRYTGSGDSTDRAFTFNGTGNSIGWTFNASGTGALNLTNTGSTSNVNTGANQSRIYTLTGTSTADNTFASELGNNGANSASLTKSGIGTWVISGSNTFTGASTLSGGGTLILDYGAASSPQDNSRLFDTTVLTLNNGGGNLTLRGGSHVEVVGSVTIGSGGHTSITRDGGSATIAFGVINRSQSAGGTLSLAEDNLATTTSTVFQGILGGGITVGSNWAKVSSGNIVALETTDYTDLPTGATAATVNYQLTGSQTRAVGASVNSLRITGDGNDQTLTISSGNLTPSIVGGSTFGNSGGILYSGGGNNNYTITGAGNIQGQNGSQELIINTYTGTLTVDMAVTTGTVGGGAGLTKSGAGTLVLTKAGTYTSTTYVNQGALRLANNTAAGTAAGGIVVQNGAALELANNITVGAEALTITGTGVSNGGALRNVAGNTSTYGGAITIGNGGARINSDAGASLTLTNNLVTSVFNDATIGGSGNTTISGVISGAGNLIKDGSGKLTLSGAGTNTLSGETLINSGTLLIASTAADAIANTSTLRIASGAKLELGAGVTETVGVLYLGGQPAGPGTWGSATSTAGNMDSVYFTGTGSITVSQTGSGTPYEAQGPAGTVIIIK